MFNQKQENLNLWNVLGEIGSEYLIKYNDPSHMILIMYLNT